MHARANQDGMTLVATVFVTLLTTLGSIHVALDDVRAPKTVANFLWYARHGAYDGGRFHRTVTTHPDNQPHNRVKIDVIQASAAPAWDARLRAPVAFEPTSRTGIRHRDGTISIARDPGLDTAQADFFICIGDQPSLDDGGKRSADHRGFAAFGRVTSGMDVVRAIHTAHADGQTLAPPIPIVRVAVERPPS
jgi:peptidyl-prolyl cis-trans isomerase A (cyclophilin A)